MNQKGKTKEERFLVSLYQTACQLGNYAIPVDRFELGKSLGIHPKGVNTIANQLLQANFIKKDGPDKVYLTAHGKELVDFLIHDES